MISYVCLFIYMCMYSFLRSDGSVSVRNQVQQQDESSSQQNGAHTGAEGEGGREADGRQEVRRRSKTEVDRGSHEHTNTDAGLRNSEYINVENLAPIDADDGLGDDDCDDDEDGELNKVGFTGFAIRGSYSGDYPASIKLRSHPALRKSLSLMEDDINPTTTPMAQLVQQAAKRPKNRAPPPPPSSSSSTAASSSGGAMAGASVAKKSDGAPVAASKPPSGHKRSKSAQLLDSGNYGGAEAEILAEAERRSPLDDHQSSGRHGRYAGHLSPAPSPPPQGAGGRRSPKQSGRDGTRSPKDARSRSPSQQRQQQRQENRKSSAENVIVDASRPSAAKPHPSAAGRPSRAMDVASSRPTEPPSNSSSASGQPVKKAKVAIPSRPPPPPGPAPRQQLLPRAAPPPVPPGYRPTSQQQDVPAPGKGRSTGLSAASNELVRGQQPSSASASSSGAAAKRRSGAAQGQESAGDNMSPKPKRQAPPPPTNAAQRISPQASPVQGRPTAPKEPPPPNYAEVMQQDRAKGVGAVGGAGKRGSAGDSVVPKPRRAQQLPSEVQVWG